ncbi:MAG: STAS domain-containing protein [Magnetococcus sp. YQC-5]
MANNKMIVKNDGKTLTIQLPSVFTFNQHQAFREAYQKHLQVINHYVIDLLHVELLDSSALGILLVFYKTAKGTNEKATFSLIHSKPQVRRLLEMAHFQEMFKVL